MKMTEGMKFTENHEWVRVEGNRAYVGITDFAVQSLGDIVYVELPEINSKHESGDVLGVVESVKAASDIYCPVAGKVVEVNEALGNSPEMLNQAPYESWIAVLQLSEGCGLENLLDINEYENLV